jgi:diketogulonate reductase-like aldo/keto reductase
LETWKALEKLKKDGRVRSIGVSNYNVHHLNEILEQKGGQIPVVNQIEMHPFLYRTRKELIEYCREHQIVIEAYSPLTRGKRLGNSTLQEVGDKHGKTSAQVLLRWCVEKGFVTLPKSVHEQRLRENFGVFDWHLDKTDIEALDRLDNGQCVAWNPLEWE